MEIVTCVLTAAVLVLAVLLDRQARRAHEERHAHRLEIAGLLERVRSPELVKPEPKIPEVVEVPAVGFDDDVQYWKAVSGGDTR